MNCKCLLFTRSDPVGKRPFRFCLPVRDSPQQKISNRPGRQKRKSATVFYFLIAAFCQLIKVNLIVFIAPQLRYAQRCINREFEQGRAGKINFDSEVRRRIKIEINFFARNLAGVLNIKAIIRFCTFPFFFFLSVAER